MKYVQAVAVMLTGRQQAKTAAETNQIVLIAHNFSSAARFFSFMVSFPFCRRNAAVHV